MALLTTQTPCISKQNVHAELQILSMAHPRDELVFASKYPLVISNFVMNLSFPNLSNKSFTHGIGNESVIITAFSFLKSVHNRLEPSGFGTRSISATHALSDLSIIPCANKSSISL